MKTIRRIRSICANSDVDYDDNSESDESDENYQTLFEYLYVCK